MIQWLFVYILPWLCYFFEWCNRNDFWRVTSQDDDDDDAADVDDHDDDVDDVDDDDDDEDDDDDDDDDAASPVVIAGPGKTQAFADIYIYVDM